MVCANFVGEWASGPSVFQEPVTIGYPDDLLTDRSQHMQVTMYSFWGIFIFYVEVSMFVEIFIIDFY